MKPQRIAMTHQLVLGYGLHKHVDVYVREACKLCLVCAFSLHLTFWTALRSSSASDVLRAGGSSLEGVGGAAGTLPAAAAFALIPCRLHLLPPVQRPRLAQYDELTAFHDEKFVDMLRDTTPELQARRFSALRS